jgi:hypothetical protein
MDFTLEPALIQSLDYVSLRGPPYGSFKRRQVLNRFQVLPFQYQGGFNVVSEVPDKADIEVFGIGEEVENISVQAREKDVAWYHCPSGIRQLKLIQCIDT